MSFRTRIAIAATAAVALAIVVASGVVYAVVRAQLRGQIDAALQERADEVVRAFTPRLISDGDVTIRLPSPPLGASGGYVQIISAGGRAFPLGQDAPAFVPGAAERAVAAGRDPARFRDVYVGETHVRVLTAPLATGFAVQVARSLEEVDSSLNRTAVILVVVGLLGIGVAAIVGAIVARSALAPVRRLTDAAEHVASTSDLSQRIESAGSDELSRLASSFNAMLAALDMSRSAQRRLVADASHELRTPLTSLRTNVEVLARGDSLPATDREELRRDILAQIEDLSLLVGDLVELARDRIPAAEMEDLALLDAVEEAVDRARRNAPGIEFRVSGEPCYVRGVPSLVARALANLLDNAAKYSPQNASVDVDVRDGVVTVRDRGPGFKEEDLPMVFDRFYRAPSARALPGSGLGLAIVRHVAETHGGSAEASNAPGGGALLVLRLPTAP